MSEERFQHVKILAPSLDYTVPREAVSGTVELSLGEAKLKVFLSIIFIDVDQVQEGLELKMHLRDNFYPVDLFGVMSLRKIWEENPPMIITRLGVGHYNLTLEQMGKHLVAQSWASLGGDFPEAVVLNDLFWVPRLFPPGSEMLAAKLKFRHMLKRGQRDRSQIFQSDLDFALAQYVASQ